MAALPPGSARRRPRRGSLERPVNGRLYRGTWLLVGFPLLLRAFSVLAAGAAAAPPPCRPLFDRRRRVALAPDLARPTRTGCRAPPGDRARRSGSRPARSRTASSASRTAFAPTRPGRGERTLENWSSTVPGPLAGRDRRARASRRQRHRAGRERQRIRDRRARRARARLRRARRRDARCSPTHTLLFLSTDGGASAALGAAPLRRARTGARVIAVVDLDAIAGSGRRASRSPATGRTRRRRGSSRPPPQRVLEQTGRRPAPRARCGSSSTSASRSASTSRRRSSATRHSRGDAHNGRRPPAERLRRHEPDA